MNKSFQKSLIFRIHVYQTVVNVEIFQRIFSTAYVDFFTSCKHQISHGRIQISNFLYKSWSCLKCLEQVNSILPNDGFMLIYHGTKQTSPETNPSKICDDKFPTVKELGQTVWVFLFQNFRGHYMTPTSNLGSIFKGNPSTLLYILYLHCLICTKMGPI